MIIDQHHSPARGVLVQKGIKLKVPALVTGHLKNIDLGIEQNFDNILHTHFTQWRYLGQYSGHKTQLL